MIFIDNLKNKLDFFLRNKFAFSRKNYCEKNEDKEGLLASPKALAKEKYLFEKYDLEDLKNNSTRLNYLENLYMLELLDKYLEAPLRGASPTKILDIGCKNWFYAKGEYFFFKKHLEEFNLKGIELDPNRMYSNFYSRKEVAKFHIKNLKNTEYIEGDFLNHNQNYDYLIWILPFVFEYPHLRWGLPLTYFKPEIMLQHAWKILNENGQIFVINQGEAEFEYQQKMCERLKIPFTPIGEIQSKFMDYKIGRYFLIIQKNYTELQ